MPPFLTASFSIARAETVPCEPTSSSPIALKIPATLSPTAGVGARDKSITPKGIFNLFAISLPTSSPVVVIL